MKVDEYDEHEETVGHGSSITTKGEAETKPWVESEGRDPPWSGRNRGTRVKGICQQVELGLEGGIGLKTEAKEKTVPHSVSSSAEA